MVVKIYKLCAWLLHWLVYFLVIYILLLILYNIVKFIIRTKPFQWHRVFFNFLLQRLRNSRWWLFFSEWPRQQRSFERRLRALETQWSVFVVKYHFFLEAYKISYAFRINFSVSLWQRYLQQLAIHLVDFLRKHFFFIVSCAVHFVRRPWLYRWSLFRFLKHFLGWSLGIAFYYYCFLWVAYVCYFLFDLFFLFLDVSFIYFFNPCFLGVINYAQAKHSGDPLAVMATDFYKATVGRCKYFILIVLFEQLPSRIKSLKDYYISREFFWLVLVYGSIRFVLVKIARLINFILYFILFTARYQTTFLYYRLRRHAKFYYYYGKPILLRFIENVFTVLGNIWRYLRYYSSWTQTKYIVRMLWCGFKVSYISWWRLRLRVKFIVFKEQWAMALLFRWKLLVFYGMSVLLWFYRYWLYIFIPLAFLTLVTGFIQLFGFFFFFKFLFWLAFGSFILYHYYFFSR